MIKSISAITLATHNMSRAVRFYRMLGFEIVHGGDDAAFTSFRAGTNYLNLIAQPAKRNWSWWGRVVFYHSNVDSLHASVVAAGYRPDTAPRDAEWGERFFHLTDPDGHELALPGHCDNVKPLMSWHESLYNLSRDSVVDDDVLRIAVLDFRSGVKTGGIGMSASCPLFPQERRQSGHGGTAVSCNVAAVRGTATSRQLLG
jgi:catechol 2,3-dioxygenase-like lactoylglutathione lyase family enzyme